MYYGCNCLISCVCYITFSLLVCILADYLATVIHELTHCISYILLADDGSDTQCYLKYPWFLPNIHRVIGTYNIDIGKLKLVVSPRGSFSVIIPRQANRFTLASTLILGPLVSICFLITLSYITGIRLLNILIIVEIIANLYPSPAKCNFMVGGMTDGLRAIRLFYPRFKGFDNNNSVITIAIGCYIVYSFQESLH